MKLTDDIIEAYLDGEFSGPQAVELERQLKAQPAEAAQVAKARRLRALLQQAAPEVPSQRMWKGIRARLAAGEGLERVVKPSPSLWQRLQEFLATPSPALRWGYAGVAVLFLAVIGLRINHTPELNPTPVQAVAVAVPQALAAAPRSAEVRVAAAKPNQAEQPQLASAQAILQPKGPTEVEQALADQDVNGAMNAIVLERDRVGSRPYLTAPSLSAQQLRLRSGSQQGTQLVGDSSVSLVPQAAPVLSKVQVPDSRAAADGSWDFNPASLALNSRDWSTAAAELQSAAAHAPALPDRAFATSSLQLLSQLGQPLAGAENAPDESVQGLSVQSAGRWQYSAGNRAAVYSSGVVTRMAGLRGEGASMELDLGADRAAFSPGTHFVRLADDASTKVVAADGSLIHDNEFNALRGAEYVFSQGLLRLK